jgi:hypothetical protein
MIVNLFEHRTRLRKPQKSRPSTGEGWRATSRAPSSGDAMPLFVPMLTRDVERDRAFSGFRPLSARYPLQTVPGTTKVRMMMLPSHHVSISATARTHARFLFAESHTLSDSLPMCPGGRLPAHRHGNAGACTAIRP